MPVPTAQKIRFGEFELDRQTAELFKHGTKLKLQGQPIAVLTLLLEHPGELVSREEIRRHLWPEDTFVDFEHSLNTHIKKLRQVFDDDAETPRYIETLPRRGYRFVAPVEAVPNGSEVVAGPIKEGSEAERQSLSLEATPVQVQPLLPKSKRWLRTLAGLAVLAIAAAAVYWFLRPRTPVVTGIHQLTHTGHQKCQIGTGYFPVTDGTRVYFGEFRDSKWHVAQVSTKGGEVSYLDLPMIDSPIIDDMSGDGSELLIHGPSEVVGESAYWLLPLPDGPARRIPGTFAVMTFLSGTNQLVYLHSADMLHLFASDLDGSHARLLLTKPASIVLGSISPDGSMFRFGTSDGKIWESRVDGTRHHRILGGFQQEVCCDNWPPYSRLYLFASPIERVYNLWGVSDSLWSRVFPPSRPTQLTSGPISFQFATVSRDGRQLFALGEILRGEISRYEASSNMFHKYLSGISAGFTDFSRDGQWIAYVTHPQGTLWRSRIDGSERMQLTFPPMGPILNPKWSPDGRLIAFTEMLWDPKYETRVYLVSTDGGAPMLLLSGDFKPADPTWSPDGKSIAYGGPAYWRGTSTEIRILNLDTKESKTVPGSQGLFSPRWSPDGQYISAHSADQTRLFLYSFQTGAWEQLPAAKPPRGTYLGWESWSHDSRYLYFMMGTSVYKVHIPDGVVELAATAASEDIICPVFPWRTWFGLTPDDEVLMLLDRSVDEVYALDLEYR